MLTWRNQGRMLQINKAEDFYLAYNLMIRLYLKVYDAEILEDICKVTDEYAEWFGERTIINALRDLLKPTFWSEGVEVPKEQREKCDNLICALLKYGIAKEKKRDSILTQTSFKNGECQKDENSIIFNFGDLTDCIGSAWGRKYFNDEDFCEWIKEKHLNDNVELKEKRDDDTLPVKATFLPVFRRVCVYMLLYSYGRHTHMPYTCRGFIMANKNLLSKETLLEIKDFLEMQYCHTIQSKSISLKRDYDNWIELQREIEEILLKCSEKEYDEPEGTVELCKAWEDQRAEGELIILKRMVDTGKLTIQEVAEELGKTVEQVTELIEALKRDSIAKLVEDLKKAEERADKEGWLMAEEVRRSVE